MVLGEGDLIIFEMEKKIFLVFLKYSWKIVLDFRDTCLINQINIQKFRETLQFAVSFIKFAFIVGL